MIDRTDRPPWIEDYISFVNCHASMDFKNFITADVEYAYNQNGAMAKDLNKGISNIQYNSLNLPKQLDIKSPMAEARNIYLYSGAGVKLRTIQHLNPNYSTTY